MAAIDLFNHLLVGKSANFFKKVITRGTISKATVRKMLADGSSNRIGKPLGRELRHIVHIDAQRTASFSGILFRFQKSPTFLDDTINNVFESRLGYVVLVEYGDYIAVIRKGAKPIDSFLKHYSKIDNDILQNFGVTDDTLFNKFVMHNLDSSDSAVMSKTLTSNNLKDNTSALSSRTYALKNLRYENDGQVTSVGISTSSINDYEVGIDVGVFVEWCADIADKIEAYHAQDNFLSIFARTADYLNNYSTLGPISILVHSDVILDMLEGPNPRISACYYKLSDGTLRNINLAKYISRWNSSMKVEKRQNAFFVDNSIDKKLRVGLYKTGIHLKGRKLNRIQIEINGVKESLVSLMNRESLFNVYFENLGYVYQNKKLFEDNKLLGNIDAFLDVFKPYPWLSRVKSEKGIFYNGKTFLDPDSIFGFVEGEIGEEKGIRYLICDDMSKEWADHIVLKDDKIAFYVSKYGTSIMSASDFQVAVGQAQKNLGSYTPMDSQFTSKEKFWQKNYNNDNAETNISRIRKGFKASDAVALWKDLIKKPNTTREMNLVVNFISKSDIKERVEKLQGGQRVKDKAEVIQILWLLSSLISSCQESGVKVNIYCKP